MDRKTTIRQNNKIRFSLGICVFVLWGIFLITVATFTQITLTKIGLPTFLLKRITTIDYANCCKYIPQIPVVLFVASMLGRKYGFIAISLYILLGTVVTVVVYPLAISIIEERVIQGLK